MAIAEELRLHNPQTPKIYEVMCSEPFRAKFIVDGAIPFNTLDKAAGWLESLALGDSVEDDGLLRCYECTDILCDDNSYLIDGYYYCGICSVYCVSCGKNAVRNTSLPDDGGYYTCLRCEENKLVEFLKKKKEQRKMEEKNGDK